MFCGGGRSFLSAYPLPLLLSKGDDKVKDKENKKRTAYIRKDGWVYSEEGMENLVKAGYKGFNRFMESMQKQIGQWHRVLKPLDRDAAAIVKSVKGLVARAQFVSSAIVKESERREKKGAMN